MTEADPRRAGLRILAIDDDPDHLDNLQLCLRADGHALIGAPTLGEGLRLAAEPGFDLCLLDRNLGLDSGVDALPQLAELAPGMRVIMLTAHGEVDDALAALALGAADYLVKPCSPAQLRVAVSRQREALRAAAAPSPADDTADDGIEIGSANAAMAVLLGTARRVAGTDANLLLLGESGTGKGVLAQAIHRWSARAAAPFATVSCPSLSPELLESELFGHVRGAFTGAHQSTRGRIGHADGGSLFLDEIGDLPLPLQAKLLRFIEDRSYERLGDPQTRHADVRIIAATHRDLAALVVAGHFRADLYYRLNVVALCLPPLRERREDIPTLAGQLLQRCCQRHGLPPRRFSAAAVQLLAGHDWPGNVRELQNVIERAAILSAGETIDADALGLAASASAPGDAERLRLDAVERRHIEAIVASSPTLEIAARRLGIDASTLYRKRRAYAGER